MIQPLHGVLSALLTTFDADGALDEATLRRVVDRNIDGGVHGVVACGSTGEFTTLTRDERRRVVEVVVDQTDGRVPVVAQTGGQSTTEAIALSRHAEQAGADAVMVVAPYYEPLSLAETRRYLTTVAGSIGIPVMLYNLPVATGVNMDPDFVGELAREVDNIAYIKDTSADMAQAGALVHRLGGVIRTFVGWDSLLLPALAEGAAGVMAGTANLLAAQLVSIHAAIGEGDLDRARSEWEAIYPLVDAIMHAPFMPAIKHALNATGFAVGNPRLPILPLGEQEGAAIARLAAAVPSLAATR